MSVRQKRIGDDELELGEDNDDFEDDSKFEFGEDLDDKEDSKDKYFDESFDDFDTGIRNQPDVYRIWLDTDPHLRNVYLSLTNQMIKKIKYIRDGKTYYKTRIVPISKDIKPLANELGIGQIMGNLKAFVSSPIVQGNLTETNYHSQMLWFSEKFVITLWTNRINWDIDVHNIQQINTIVVGSVELFTTRLIGNLERSRERVNPNSRPMESQSGIIDKIAFWRKDKEGRA